MLLSFRVRILVLLLAVTIGSAGILTFLARYSMDEAVKEREMAHARNILEMTTLHLDENYNTLFFVKKQSLIEKREVLTNITALSLFYMDSINISVDKGLLPVEAAQKIVLGNISRYRFYNNDFFIVIDDKYNILSHPDKQLVGTSILDFKDRKGKYVARNIISKIEEEGSIFSTYYGTKPDSGEIGLKHTYWAYYPRWKWIIAGGFYFADIEVESQAHLDFMLEEISQTFKKLQIGRTGYLFLFNGSKSMLIHPTIKPEDDFSTMRNPITGKMISEEFMEAAKKEGDNIVYYKWDKPKYPGEFRFDKLAILTYYEPFDYYVGYTVYKDDLNQPAEDLTHSFSLIVLAFLALIGFLAVVLSNAVTRPIGTLISQMSRIIEQGIFEPVIPPTGTKEIKELGGIFSRMIGSIKGAHEKLARANKNIMDSIGYASLIQTSILPGQEQFASYLPDNFVLWEPRDIVSGDFYQIYPKGEGFFLFLGDCTGHGVPGGFLTMFCVSALRRIIFSEHIHDPGTILMRLHGTIQEALGNKSDQVPSDDGLDGGVCYINLKKNMFYYSGARVDLILVSPDKKVRQIKGDRNSIGYSRSKKGHNFQTYKVPFEPGTGYYLSTDGLFDQTGGKQNYCFGKNRFIECMKDNAHRSLQEQKSELIYRLVTHQRDTDRLDDITVIGFKINL